MKKLYLFSFAVLSLLLFGCSTNNNILDNWGTQINGIEDFIVNNNANSFDITDYSREILTLMQEDKWNKISTFVHPTRWVRFSPYTYIDIDNSMVLYPTDFQGDLNAGELLRGYTDGAGFEINETKYNYFNKWVYATGFLYADQILINQKIARWNNLNNIDDIFPNSQSIEYYFDGFNPEYEWLDWISLTLVFEEYNWYYYLVWLIRGSWTI